MSGITTCCSAYDLPVATVNVTDVTDVAEQEGLMLLGL